MVTRDYKTLKIGLEGLAIEDKIPIEHHEVPKNCESTLDRNIEMDVSDYEEEHIESIMEEIDLEMERKDNDTIIVKGDF
jgi:hypothetical protein